MLSCHLLENLNRRSLMNYETIILGFSGTPFLYLGILDHSETLVSYIVLEIPRRQGVTFAQRKLRRQKVWV